MSFYILPESGVLVFAGIVQRITYLKLQTDAVIERMKAYSNCFSLKFKEGRLSRDSERPNLAKSKIYWKSILILPKNSREYLITPTYLRLMIHFTLIHIIFMLLCTANDNPLLDSRLYEFEHVDGKKQAISANIIAENIFETCVEECRQPLLLDSINDHRRLSIAIETGNEFILSNGIKRHGETTCKGGRS